MEKVQAAISKPAGFHKQRWCKVFSKNYHWYFQMKLQMSELRGWDSFVTRWEGSPPPPITDFEFCPWEKQLMRRLRSCWWIRGLLFMSWRKTCRTLRGRSMSSVRRTRTVCWKENICLCHMRVSMCVSCTPARVHQNIDWGHLSPFKRFLTGLAPIIYSRSVSMVIWLKDPETQRNELMKWSPLIHLV